MANTFDNEKRIVRGIATNDTVDKVGDTIDPHGVTFETPCPILAHHKHDKPIGILRKKKLLAGDWHIEVELVPEGKSAAADECWANVQLGSIPGFSIGFRPVRATPNSKGGLDYSKILVHEISLVSIPCNPAAQITAHSTAKQLTPATAAPVPPAPAAASAPAQPKQKLTPEGIAARKRLIADHEAQKRGFSSHADRKAKLARLGISLN